MIRNFVKSAFFAAAVIASGALMSCGGSGDSVDKFVKEAIDEAEANVAITDVPVFGAFTSINEQRKAASASLREKLKTLNLKEETKEERLKKREITKEAHDAVNAYFDKKIEDEVNKLDGSEVKVDFDSKQISAAKVTLIKNPHNNRQVRFAFDITLAKPLANKNAILCWKFMDKDGKEIDGSGAMVIKESGGEVTDSKVVVNGPTNMRATTLDKLFLDFF